jgi:diguanylate cyclase (GGDEF)-like protein
MTLRVLIVEPEAEELLFLQDVIREIEQERLLPEWSRIEPQCAVTWSEAQRMLSTSSPHAILLDPQVDLDEEAPAQRLRLIQSAALDTPVIVMAAEGQEELALQLIREGAQDFVFKKQIDCAPLAHSLRNAILRHKLLAAARCAALTDSLTGLPNRSAFLSLAERDRKLAERLGRRWMLLIAEPRNLEQISLALGDQRRDLELMEAAEQLRGMITPADMIGRIGERHFAISVFDGDAESAEEAWARIRSAASQSRIEIGASIFDISRPIALDAMLEQALNDLPRKSTKTAGVA